MRGITLNLLSDFVLRCALSIQILVLEGGDGG
jgi:hypothetical protein